jgi:hypothetical protein
MSHPIFEPSSSEFILEHYRYASLLISWLDGFIDDWVSRQICHGSEHLEALSRLKLGG